MNRRGFLGSILALGAAPAIVRAESLMRVVSRTPTFSEIIASTLAARRDEVAANIAARNSLLIELMERRIATAQAVMAAQLTESLYGPETPDSIIHTRTEWTQVLGKIVVESP